MKFWTMICECGQEIGFNPDIWLIGGIKCGYCNDWFSYKLKNGKRMKFNPKREN